MAKEIVVKKVNLQQDEVDRLNNTIDMQKNTIKYQQDQYLKLLKKLDNEPPYGLNCLLFTYDEIIKILSSQYHPLKDYLERWFGTYEDFNANEGLFFSEDGIEVEKDDYWLVNIKTDYACSFKDIDRLNRKVYELERSDKNDKRAFKCWKVFI